MTRRYKIVVIVILLITVAVLATVYFNSHPVAVLNPKGPIANNERDLIYTAVGLSVLVVIPVFILTFYIAWKYRESNKHALYKPDWDRNLAAEIAWWGIPSIIIFVLSIITWNSSHALDPSRALTSTKQMPINIQVVALNWKWLFIYPEQGVATVNLAEIPVDAPVNFEITSDAPMNSFWIPQLGGQIYAMPGMVTRLHLMASQAGNYYGSSSNISGAGFAGMKFNAHATSMADFNNWAKLSRHFTKLSSNTYAKLSQNSQNNPVAIYALGDKNLFSEVVGKYMAPSASMSDTRMSSSMGEMKQ